MDNTPCCEYPEFDRFLTEQEKEDAYEGCIQDLREDADYYADQDYETSQSLLECAVACEGDLAALDEGLL